MEMLTGTKYGIESKAADGPVGTRHVVADEETGRRLLADVVSPGEDEYLTAICRNALCTEGCTSDPAVANVVQTGWLKDGRYLQVLDLSPDARRFAGKQARLDESQFWIAAWSLVASLRHLHRRELVHGSIAPACVYEDGAGIKLAELWFMHTADGEPLYPGLSEYFPASLPEFFQLYASPEVLLGETPQRESDIFSLGGVLFYLLTAEAPRDLALTRIDRSSQGALAEAVIKPLVRLRPDLSDEAQGFVYAMLDRDPAERPTAFLLQSICVELGKQPTNEGEVLVR